MEIFPDEVREALCWLLAAGGGSSCGGKYHDPPLSNGSIS